LQATDRACFLIRQSTRNRRLVANAAGDLQTHVEGDILGQVTDHVLGIDDLDRVVDGDVTGGDHALALLAQGQCGLVMPVHADGHVLDVEQDFNDVLLQTLKRGVLMQDVVDFDLGDGAAGDRGQEDATQSIAERVAETTFQRLDHDLGVIETGTLDLNAAGTQHIGGSCHEQGLRKLRWITSSKAR
jgi:hypothetical protein